MMIIILLDILLKVDDSLDFYICYVVITIFNLKFVDISLGCERNLLVIDNKKAPVGLFYI